MSPSAVIRYQARETLKGNYVAAVAAFIILLLPVYIIMGVTYAVDSLFTLMTDDAVTVSVLEIVALTPINIIIGILLSPLANGFIRLFYVSAMNGEFRMSALFYYFEKGRYHKTLLMNLSFLVRIMIPAFICFLPLFLYYFFCFGYFDSFVGTVLYYDFAFILSVMSSILLILYSLKYFVVLTLYCSSENADVKELFGVSKDIMREQKTEGARLIFSFVPWLLLCLLIVPMLYVIPYMTQSLCIGAKWMTMKGN